MNFVIVCIYGSAIIIAVILTIFYIIWHKKHHTIIAPKNKKNNKNNKNNTVKNFKIVNKY